MQTDEPSQRGPWIFRLSQTVTVALAVFFLYLLSSGPAWWLHTHGVLSERVFRGLYLPVGYFMEHSPGDIFFRYLSWWSPVVRF